MSYSSPPPPPGYGGGSPYGQPAAAGTNQKAIWSLVTGIVGLLCCQIISVVAIVLSQSAKKDIQQSGQGGSGLATAGFVLGIIGIVLLVINIILIATGHYYFHFNSDSNN